MRKNKKGKRGLILPITPMLREALDAVERKGDTVLMTQYGKPFSEKSITGRMRVWTEAADMPTGCTLHGLRKTLGKCLPKAAHGARCDDEANPSGAEKTQGLTLWLTTL